MVRSRGRRRRRQGGEHALDDHAPTRPRPGRLLALALLLALGGCGRAPTAAGARLPAGCDARTRAAVPATRALPPSPGPLPAYGAPILAAGLAAAPHGSLYAATATGLYRSSDGGSAWRALALPAGMRQGPAPLAAASGGRLAAVFGDRLALRAGPGGTWRFAQARNVFALATDPAQPGVLVALGGTGGPHGTTTLYVWTHWGAAVRALSLPTPLLGSAVAVQRGTAWAALGAPAGPARLYQAALGGGTARPWSPAPPEASRGAVLGLASTPGGAALLLTAGGLFTSDGPGAAWVTVALPAGPPAAALAVRGTTWYVLQQGAGASEARLWASSDGGRTWGAVPVPPGPLGRPVEGAGALWLPTGGGPYRLGGGGGVYRAHGIPAPLRSVSSAPLRPADVAVSWSGGLLVSTDGGARFRYAPPGGLTASRPAIVSWTPGGACLVARLARPTDQGVAAYLSGDAGRHWTPLPAPVRGAPITALTEYPRASGLWWAVSDRGLYRSAAGHAAWSRVALPAAAPAPAVLGAGRRLWLLGGQGTGLWSARLTPSGLGAARPAWGAGFGATRLAVDPYARATLYAGAARTLDAGAHWDIPEPGPWGAAPARATAFLPGSPGALLVRGGALWQDAGAQWRLLWGPGGGRRPGATGVAAAGPDLVYLAVPGRGLLRIPVHPAWRASAPPAGSGHWRLPGGWPRPSPPPLEAAYPSDPHRVYRLDAAGQLSRSRDGGAHFGAPLRSGCCPSTSAGRPRVLPTALAVSPTDPLVLLLGLGPLRPGSARGGVLRSENGGRTWTRGGLPADQGVTGLALASTRRAFATAGGNLWETLNGGAGWSVRTGPIDASAVAAGPDGTVVVGGLAAPGGLPALWLSADGGQNWRAAPIRLPGWPVGRPPAAVFRLMDGALFAAGPGLAESVDGGTHWASVSASVGDPAVLGGGLQPTPAGTIAVRTAHGLYQFRP